jgi:chemotaxis protein MotD
MPLRANEKSEPQPPITHPPSSMGTSHESRVADSLPEATEPVRVAPRTTVVSQQNVPAPMASTALVLVDSIAGSTPLGAPNTTPSPNAIHASATHASAQSLKIQLHPAELGMVTATLRFVGEQLSIELKVENHEAYRRLTSDSETIVGSLRDLGYDIDKITILQPSIASAAAARSDSPTAMPALASRSGDQFSSTMSNGGNAGSGERSAGDGGKQEQGEQKGPPLRIEIPESGLYI